MFSGIVTIAVALAAGVLRPADTQIQATTPLFQAAIRNGRIAAPDTTITVIPRASGSSSPSQSGAALPTTPAITKALFENTFRAATAARSALLGPDGLIAAQAFFTFKTEVDIASAQATLPADKHLAGQYLVAVLQLEYVRALRRSVISSADARAYSAELDKAMDMIEKANAIYVSVGR